MAPRPLFYRGLFPKSVFVLLNSAGSNQISSTQPQNMRPHGALKIHWFFKGFQPQGFKGHAGLPRAPLRLRCPGCDLKARLINFNHFFVKIGPGAMVFGVFLPIVVQKNVLT